MHLEKERTTPHHEAQMAFGLPPMRHDVERKNRGQMRKTRPWRLRGFARHFRSESRTVENRVSGGL